MQTLSVPGKVAKKKEKISSVLIGLVNPAKLVNKAINSLQMQHFGYVVWSRSVCFPDIWVSLLTVQGFQVAKILNNAKIPHSLV